MHTTTLYRESHFYVNPTRRLLVAHHNGDFSGQVVLLSRNAEGDTQQLVIPFQALKKLVGEYLRHEKISALEQIKAAILVDLAAGSIT